MLICPAFIGRRSATFFKARNRMSSKGTVDFTTLCNSLSCFWKNRQMETHSGLNGVTHFWGFLRKCNYYKMKVYLLLFKTLRVRGCSGHKYCWKRVTQIPRPPLSEGFAGPRLGFAMWTVERCNVLQSFLG